MAARAYFGFPRVTSAFTLFAGSWEAAYPVTQLQVLPLSYVARTTDATTASTAIRGTGSSPQLASVIALIGHNMSQAATIRVRTWTDTASSVGLVDSGFVDVWDASYTADQLDGAVATWFYRFAEIGPATVGSFRIDIDDTANPDGYIQAGYLEIASAFDVEYNFGFGSEYGFEWRSQVAESMGGAEYVERRDHPRLFKGSFPLTVRNTALGLFYEMQRQLRMDEPVLFVPLPDETTHLLRTAMFARHMDPGLITMRSASSAGLIDSVPLALKEIIG